MTPGFTPGEVFFIANRNDVAKKAGVSGATVSRVFNSPEGVNEQTREAVLAAAKELGYHPNIIASNFVRGRSGNIGVIIPQIPNVHIFSVHYFSELLSGISEALESRGYDLVLFFHKKSLEGENDYFRYFNRGKVDGCIFLGTGSRDGGLLKIKQAGYGFCLVNNYISGSGISFIDVDNVKGSRMAVNHLIRRGHREIAFINGPDTYANSLDRLEGYKQTLQESGLGFDENRVVTGNYGRKSGYTAAEKLLGAGKRPTAVFCGNDRMAVGFMQAAKERGMNIPGDIAVAGYDDSDAAVLVDPALTTVRVPFYEIGKRCAEEFCSLIESKSKNEFGIFVEPELIVRGTT